MKRALRRNRSVDPRLAEPAASRPAATEGRLRRKTDGVGLSVLLLLAISSTAVTPAALSAGLRPTSRAGSTCSAASPAVAARAAADGSNRGLAASSRSQINKHGEVVGRALNARTANGVPVSIELPVESFVGDPVDDLVIYTKYTPASGSQVRALDLMSGCDANLASPKETVRSAILDPQGHFLYIHSVKKSGRADAGVTRVDLATGRSLLVLPGLPSSKRLGPIFGTGLQWSANGSALAVQSCGLAACLTRVLDVASNAIRTFDEPAQGAFIALSGEHLVTFDACGGLPCDVVSTDLTTGDATLLAADAYAASAAPAPDGSVVVEIETASGSVEVKQ